MIFGNLLRKVLRKLLPNNSIEKILGVQICETGVMKNAIELWHDMYKNNPPWRGGKENVIPLNLPSAISEEFARLILTEFEISITGGQMGEFLNKQIEDQLTELPKYVEWYCAGGGIVVKPYVTDVDDNGNPTAIELDFVKKCRFLPVCVLTERRSYCSRIRRGEEGRRLPVYKTGISRVDRADVYDRKQGVPVRTDISV